MILGLRREKTICKKYFAFRFVQVSDNCFECVELLFCVILTRVTCMFITAFAVKLGEHRSLCCPNGLKEKMDFVLKKNNQDGFRFEGKKTNTDFGLKRKTNQDEFRFEKKHKMAFGLKQNKMDFGFHLEFFSSNSKTQIVFFFSNKKNANRFFSFKISHTSWFFFFKISKDILGVFFSRVLWETGFFLRLVKYAILNGLSYSQTSQKVRTGPASFVTINFYLVVNARLFGKFLCTRSTSVFRCSVFVATQDIALCKCIAFNVIPLLPLKYT